MRNLLTIMFAIWLVACISPVRRPDVVTAPLQRSQHNAWQNQCQSLGRVDGFSWVAGSHAGPTTGRHNATQDMLANAPRETTHVAYNYTVGFWGSQAMGEAFACPEEIRQ